MNHLVAMNSDAKMDSLDFLREIINPARIGCGEPEVKNTHFVSRVEDELDDLPAVKIIHRFGNEVRSYDLTIDQMMLVGMRESKAVRKTVLAKLKEIKNPSLPDFNDPVAAARAWADAMEGKQKLEVVLQATTAYYDVLRVIKANPAAKLNARSCWRPLKKWCIENGKQMEKVYCPRFGDVNAYPREAWLAVYQDVNLPDEAGELVRLKLN